MVEWVVSKKELKSVKQTKIFWDKNGTIVSLSFFLLQQQNMSTVTLVQLSIPAFDGHYDHWIMPVESFLRSKEHWEVVSERIIEPIVSITMVGAQRAELEGQRLKDLKAKNYIFEAIDFSILETILCRYTSKQI